MTVCDNPDCDREGTHRLHPANPRRYYCPPCWIAFIGAMKRKAATGPTN